MGSEPSKFGEQALTADSINGVSTPSEKYGAWVAGCTGASARRVVNELVNSDACTKVVCLSRRAIMLDTPENAQKTFPDINFEKIQKVSVVADVDYEDAEKLKTQLSDSASGMDKMFGFCGLGTSPFTEKVDYEYAKAFAEAAAKTEKLKGLSVVSSGGADSGSWIDYMKVIGMREDAFFKVSQENKIPLVIARPGPINREELAETRTKEKIMHAVGLKGISTTKIARTMVRGLEMEIDSGGSSTVWIAEDDHMQKVE